MAVDAFSSAVEHYSSVMPRNELKTTNTTQVSLTSYKLNHIPSSSSSFWMVLQPLWALVSFQFLDLFTTSRTTWTSDQLVTRPLPKHRTAQTQNKHIYTPNIHAVSGIRTYDPRVRASENTSCLRPLGYRDRQITFLDVLFYGGDWYIPVL
jgi:hypothetical protein